MSRKPEHFYDFARRQHYLEWATSEHVSKVEPIFDRTKDYVDELETENEELKQLVLKLWGCYGYRNNDGDCSGCYYYNNDDYCKNKCEPMWDACLWEHEMQELGIEVDGC